MNRVPAAKRLTAVVMLLFVGYGSWVAGVTPLWDAYRTYASSADTAQRLLERYSSIAKQQDYYDSAIPTLESIAVGDGLLWPHGTQVEVMTRMHDQIEALFDDRSNLLSIEFDEPIATESQLIREIPVRIEYIIHKADVGKIMHSIEASRPLIVIESLKIHAQEKGVFVKLELVGFTLGRVL